MPGTITWSRYFTSDAVLKVESVFIIIKIYAQTTHGTSFVQIPFGMFDIVRFKKLVREGIDVLLNVLG